MENCVPACGILRQYLQEGPPLPWSGHSLASRHYPKHWAEKITTIIPGKHYILCQLDKSWLSTPNRHMAQLCSNNQSADLNTTQIHRCCTGAHCLFMSTEHVVKSNRYRQFAVEALAFQCKDRKALPKWVHSSFDWINPLLSQHVELGEAYLCSSPQSLQ